MPFNDNQLFYAALWLTETLPGGRAFTDDICKAHGKPFVCMNAPELGGDIMDRADCEAFFNDIHGLLKSGKGLQPTADPAQGSFIHLVWGADLYVHDNGRIFSDDGEIDYPGRPASEYRHVKLSSEDIKHAPQFCFESLYRVVPLKAGQAYTKYVETAEGLKPQERTAGKDEALILAHWESPDFAMLSDAEIRTGVHNKPGLGAALPLEEFTAGYINPMGDKVHTSGDPRIVRYVSPPVRFMEVKEKISLGRGLDFAQAEPGDLIYLRSGGDMPHVLSRVRLDSGKTRLVAPEGKRLVLGRKLS